MLSLPTKGEGRPKLLYIVIFLLVCLGFSGKLNAQIAVIGGPNCNVMRTNVIEDTDPKWGYHVGFQLQYYPIRSMDKLSLLNEITLVTKGYKSGGGAEYRYRFSYLAFPMLIDYALTPDISVQGGVEPAVMVSTSYEHGMDIFKQFDLGLAAGAGFFNSRRLSCFVRATYGFLAMVDLTLRDDWGNLEGSAKELKNLNFAVGLKFKMYHEKIKLFKE